MSHSIALAPALTDSVLLGAWQRLLMLEKENVKKSTKTVEMQALQKFKAKLEVCSSCLCVDSVSMLGAAIMYRK